MLDCGPTCLDLFFALKLFNLFAFFFRPLIHDSVVGDSIGLLQLHKLLFTVHCVFPPLLFLLLLFEILVGIRDVVLPEVQQQAFLFAPTVEVDAHATVVLTSQKLSQSFHELGWPVQCSGRFIQVALVPLHLEGVGSGRHVGGIHLARRADQRLLTVLLYVAAIEACMLAYVVLRVAHLQVVIVHHASGANYGGKLVASSVNLSPDAAKGPALSLIARILFKLARLLAIAAWILGLVMGALPPG